MEHSHLGVSKQQLIVKGGGPVKELTAASALTSLVHKPPVAATSSGESEVDFDIPQRFTKSGRKKAIPFPVKLMKVLSQKEYNEIITWLPDGKSFTIVRPKAFVTEILITHFKQAKYSSFTRKLHRWGFQRHLRGEEAGAFFHKLFQRGRLDMVEKMTCYKADHSKPMPMMSGMGPGGFGKLSNPSQMVSFRDPVISRHPSMNRSSLMSMQQQSQQMQQQHSLMNSMQEQLGRSPMHPSSQRAGGQGGAPGGGSAGPSGSAVGGNGGESLASVDRLNAAIELEVNRRLKERITAATLSRQALALMQQQQGGEHRGGSGYHGGNSGAGAGNNSTYPGLNNLLGGENSLNAQQQQLLQLQQQQAQLQQQVQQQGMMGAFGNSSFAFDNNQGI